MIGYCYDTDMLLHESTEDDPDDIHPEKPERIAFTYATIQRKLKSPFCQ